MAWRRRREQGGRTGVDGVDGAELQSGEFFAGTPRYLPSWWYPYTTKILWMEKIYIYIYIHPYIYYTLHLRVYSALSATYSLLLLSSLLAMYFIPLPANPPRPPPDTRVLCNRMACDFPVYHLLHILPLQYDDKLPLEYAVPTYINKVRRKKRRKEMQMQMEMESYRGYIICTAYYR